MAAYDFGGGCSCGVEKFCNCARATPEDIKNEKEYRMRVSDNLAYGCECGARPVCDCGPSTPSPTNPDPGTKFIAVTDKLKLMAFRSEDEAYNHMMKVYGQCAFTVYKLVPVSEYTETTTLKRTAL